MIPLIIFITGLCIGSFINAFQYREQVGKKISGRSFCPKCKHQLSWYELIPVVSWVFLLGKCRHCKKPISIQYPLVELSTGALFVSVGLKSGYIKKITDYLSGGIILSDKDILLMFLSVICLLFITSCLVLIALHDFKTKYVLSAVVYLAIVVSVLAVILSYQGSLLAWPFVNYLLPFFLSSIVSGLVFYLIYAFSKGKWMGAGDIEIAFLMGVFLGWPNTLIAFYIAFILGAIAGVFLLILQRVNLKSEVPFGPFLVAGTFIAYLFGAQLLAFYDKIFLAF